MQTPSFKKASHIFVILSEGRMPEDEPEGRDGSRGIFALPWKGQFRGFCFIRIKKDNLQRRKLLMLQVYFCFVWFFLFASLRQKIPWLPPRGSAVRIASLPQDDREKETASKERTHILFCNSFARHPWWLHLIRHRKGDTFSSRRRLLWCESLLNYALPIA